MSLKFLNLKGWHPSNKANQKKIWIAEQKAKAREQAEKDAAIEVQKQSDLYKFKKMAAQRGDTKAMQEAEATTLEFMYAPPPGLKKADNQDVELTEDDAVRQFREKLERKKNPVDPSANQRNLERYVGRRPQNDVTIKDQVERFPFLKDAPVEGDYTSSVKVNFKPMGVQLRNVRCLRCGEWGHQSGDRECKLRDFNPHDAARQAMEDPAAYINKLSTVGKQDLILKKASLPLEMGESSGYGMILSEEESSDPEKEFLASLSTKEKELLLKKLRQKEKGKVKKKKAKRSSKKRSKKTKKKSRRRRSSNDSSSSSSNSDSNSSSDSDSSDDGNQEKNKTSRRTECTQEVKDRTHRSRERRYPSVERVHSNHERSSHSRYKSEVGDKRKRSRSRSNDHRKRPASFRSRSRSKDRCERRRSSIRR